MGFIIYLILILFVFFIYLNFDKIINFLYKKDKKNAIELIEEKISKRKSLGSPRRNK
jgi:hypothetical protein